MTAIHAEFVLVFAAEAGAANIVANARAASLNGAREHRDDGLA